MRVLILLSLFAASYAWAGWGREYSEEREFALDADDIGMLVVEAGAGQLTIRGSDEVRSIQVKATIVISDADEDDARQVINENMTLSLTRQGDRAQLTSDFSGSWYGDAPSPRVDLDVVVPARLALDISDGSGSLEVSDVAGPIEIVDGSGSMDLYRLGGPLKVRDSSGSIDIKDIGGDVDIDDGSGSIDVRGVRGTVRVGDGSGSIRVRDIDHDLVIVEDGSGSINYKRIGGSVIGDG